MEDANNLVRRKSALIKSGGTLLTPSQQTLVIQLDLTAANAKSSPDVELLKEFKRVFEGEAPEVIEWAFRSWRDECPFWPAVSDIRKFVARWHGEKREAVEAEKRRAEREAIEQARKDGKLVEFSEIVKGLKEKAKSMPDPEHITRNREFGQRMQRISPSLISQAVCMTPEQIEARRDKEREEIRRYRGGGA
jgi:hypothetical protein